MSGKPSTRKGRAADEGGAGATRPRALGPDALEGSRDARRLAAVILEVLSGIRTPTEAAEMIDRSLTRYYALETQALQGMVHALEPRPRGRPRRAEDELAQAREEKEALEKELKRAAALHRTLQRTVGLSATAASKGMGRKGKGKKAEKPRRGRRARPRAEAAIRALRKDGEEPPPAMERDPEEAGEPRPPS